MTANAKSMTAWIAVQSGRPRDILQMKTTMPLPAMPGPGQLMVRVSHAALNPGDIKMMAHKIPFKGSTIPGMDFVGKVVHMGPSIASSASTLGVGSTVAGTTSMMNVWRGIGILAEYVVIPAHLVVEKPESLDEHLAAGLFGVAGQTSFVLIRAANLRQGNNALINGASGGVGCFLTQALSAMGVRVTAVSSAKNEGLVRRLGAEEVRQSQLTMFGTFES
jgi:NADPH:quinone reductase-like Zn-dependent oxidoreductase